MLFRSANMDENEVHAKQWMPRERVLEILRDNRTQCGVSMLGLLYVMQFYSVEA